MGRSTCRSPVRLLQRPMTCPQIHSLAMEVALRLPTSPDNTPLRRPMLDSEEPELGVDIPPQATGRWRRCRYGDGPPRGLRLRSSRSSPDDRVGQCRPCLGGTLQRRVVGPPRRGLEPAVPRGADGTRAGRRTAAVDSPLGLPTSALDDGLAVSHTACQLPPPRLHGLHGAHEPTASPGRDREVPAVGLCVDSPDRAW